MQLQAWVERLDESPTPKTRRDETCFPALFARLLLRILGFVMGIPVFCFVCHHGATALRQFSLIS